MLQTEPLVYLLLKPDRYVKLSAPCNFFVNRYRCGGRDNASGVVDGIAANQRHAVLSNGDRSIQWFSDATNLRITRIGVSLHHLELCCRKPLTHLISSRGRCSHASGRHDTVIRVVRSEIVPILVTKP